MSWQFLETAESIFLAGQTYTLKLEQNSFLAELQVLNAFQRYVFAVGGDCRADGRNDVAEHFGRWTVVAREADGVLLSRREKSGLWDCKTMFLKADCRRVEVYFELESVTVRHIDEIRFFRLCFQGAEYGFAGNFDEVCNTAPNFQERRYYHSMDRFRITNGNDFGPNVGSQALASPVPVMGLHDRRDSCFWAVGAAARPGEYDWDDLFWNPEAVIPQTAYAGDDLYGGGFAINYCGKKTVRGVWRTPSLLMTRAEGAAAILPAFLEGCYQAEYLPRPRPRQPAAWWNRPIYCTWHDQCSYGRMQFPGSSEDRFCTRTLTDAWLECLREHDCLPGIVILDAKWQSCLNAADADPEKWPDFRGWVEQCHERGLKVFLWNLAWTAEGLPPDECITDAQGKAVACDVTNPRFVQRFRTMIRRYFSAAPDGLNCDGIKLDGQLNLPTGPGLRNHENVWGLELQKRYLALLYETAKAVKPDVCISTFCANPYLERYCDMVRIGDMYASRLTPHEAMLHRAEVYRQTMPYALIDTDGQFNQHLGDADYAEELEEQRRIGIPTLYNARWLYRWRFFLPVVAGELAPDDYRTVAAVFRRFRTQPAVAQPGSAPDDSEAATRLR